MIEMSRNHRVGTFQLIVIGKSLDACLDVIGDILLFFSVFLFPLHSLYSLVDKGGMVVAGAFCVPANDMV